MFTLRIPISPQRLCKVHYMSRESSANNVSHQILSAACRELDVAAVESTRAEIRLLWHISLFMP